MRRTPPDALLGSGAQRASKHQSPRLVVLVLMCTTLPRLAAEARWRPAAGTDACGNPSNLVQIQARLRDAIVLINSSPADDIPGCPHIRIAAACSATTV